MLRIDNRTPFASMLVPAIDERGGGYAFVVLKGTYALEPGRAPRLAEEQLPLQPADAAWGEPGRSSIRYACDLLPPKPGTDVVLVGSAHARSAVSELDVTLRAGALQKTVRVIGDRVFYRRLGSFAISDAAPFTSMPLVYERAFGGADGDAHEPRNHVGVGFVAPSGGADLEGRRLPNLEDPAALLRAPGDRPPPAGFGFVSPSWMPRLAYAGTFDERWRREQCPLLPEDFDRRFYHAAHPDLCAARPFVGGEAIAATHALPGGRKLELQLPAPSLALTSRFKRRRLENRFALGTVLIDTDRLLLLLTWTAVIPCGRELLMIDSVKIAEEAA
jgi:hypothetical protein